MTDKAYIIIELYKGKMNISRCDDIDKAFDECAILANKNDVHIILIEGLLLTETRSY
jgi:hypothetical protein